MKRVHDFTKFFRRSKKKTQNKRHMMYCSQWGDADICKWWKRVKDQPAPRFNLTFTRKDAIDSRWSNEG